MEPLDTPLPAVTRESVNRVARAQKRRTFAWFTLFVGSGLILAWIAGESYGPAADLVLGAASLLLLAAFFCGVLVYAVFKQHRYALRDLQSADLCRDPKLSGSSIVAF